MSATTSPHPLNREAWEGPAMSATAAAAASASASASIPQTAPDLPPIPPEVWAGLPEPGGPDTDKRRAAVTKAWPFTLAIAAHGLNGRRHQAARQEVAEMILAFGFETWAAGKRGLSIYSARLLDAALALRAKAAGRNRPAHRPGFVSPFALR